MQRIATIVALLLAGCTAVPPGITPVGGFQIERYLGKWYEIARLDHSFERGLTRVSATYSLRADGGIEVVNQGYSPQAKRWKKAVGKAYFFQAPDQGHLKVSFFGPFYGAYVVCALDHENYRYALVCGPDRSYLWLLARTPDLDPAIRAELIAKAAALGFDTTRLIFVDHPL